MGYDNAERFKYMVMQDCVLPKQDGGMERKRKGDQVSGPHYERFTKTGVLMRMEGPGTKAADVAPKAKHPAAEAPATEPEATEPEAPATEPEGEGDGEEEEEELTRAELEAMTKAEIMEAYEPDWTGTKAALIDHLLGEGE